MQLTYMSNEKPMAGAADVPRVGYSAACPTGREHGTKHASLPGGHHSIF